MKRIFYDNNGRIKRPYFPFWQPWGMGGCLWRAILFLFCLVLFLILLTQIKSCNNNSHDQADFPDIPFVKDENGDDDVYVPDSTATSELIEDTSTIVDWGEPITGVPELPAPGDNLIPQPKDENIIPDPEDGMGEIVDNQIIVLINSKDVKKEMADFANQFKALYADDEYVVSYYNALSGMMMLTVPQDRLQQTLSEIPQKITNIDYKLTTNGIMEGAKKPNDVGFKYPAISDYFTAIQAFSAWDVTMGSQEVKIAIVDSYFFLNHEDLNSRWVEPIHIPSKTRNVAPPAGVDKSVAFHGSHVAGIATATANNNKGVCGIAPNCKWIPVSLGDKMTVFHIMEGILYAIYQGADVVNVSIGANFPAEISKMPIAEQVKQAKTTKKSQEELWNYVYRVADERKCVIVTSAGNSDVLTALDVSKRSGKTIKVAAVDRNLKKAEFSNFGYQKNYYSTVSAPGVDILSSVGNNQYDFYPGTSMAAPFVTGTVALMKSIDKSLSVEEIISILQKTGKPLSPSDRIGPLIQIEDALQEVKNGLLNYDALLKNHSKLLGKWEATQRLILVENGKKVDDCYIYMEFTDLENGTITYKTVKEGDIYTAPLKVSFTKDNILIRQTANAQNTNPNLSPITADVFKCRPDKNRLLQCAVIREQKETFTFNMKKINKY